MCCHCCFNKMARKQFPIYRGSVCSYHVTYAFQSESTLYSCLNVKELLARSRREIWSLSDCNWIRTHNHLVRKGTLNHLAKLADLAKWLSVRLRTKRSWILAQLQSLTAGRWQFNSRHKKGTKMTINSRRIVLIGYWRFIKKVGVLECLLNSFKQFVFYSPHVFNLLTILSLV